MKFEISPKEYELKLNWEDAVLYCSMLDINGYGWRLPNKDELDEIYNSKNDFEKDWYWSSTEFFGGDAWSQFFTNGGQYVSDKNTLSYVRAIRSIK